MDDGKRIRILMAEQEPPVTVQALADKLGMSYQRLWNKLHGRTALTEQDEKQILEALGQKPPREKASPKPKAAPQPAPEETPQSETQVEDQATRFAIISSRWNELVVNALVEGALAELEAHGEEDVSVVQVPGAWEIPVAVRALLESPNKPDALIVLGCIIQGETAHAGQLAGDVSGALMSLQTSYGVPISWGILTPENEEQALTRAGLKHGNKGREAALAALEMVALVQAIAAG